MKYINYKKYSVEYHEITHQFTFWGELEGQFLKNGRISQIRYGSQILTLHDYKFVSMQDGDLEDGRKLVVHYGDGPDVLPEFDMEFLIDHSMIKFSTFSRGHADIYIEGDLLWGDELEKSTYGVCLNRNGNGLRTAHGPATSKIDNALYDRLTDRILVLDGCDRIRLGFDWGNNCFQFRMNTGGMEYIRGFKVKIYENYYAETFSVPFKPINKGHQFPTPPVGWMTWYAVQYNASEKTVLENTKWLAKNLKEYGANCIWIDWEWYHSDMSGTEAPDVNTFHPDKGRYPKGLKYLSDEIRKFGFVPALWIGVTNDPNKNGLMEENPEWVLAKRNEWCGQWWIDPSHPEVISKYIPAVFNQLLGWGYEAFKWDCLPVSLNIFDLNHDRFKNPGLSSENAFRDIVRAARNTIGDEKYMMSCSGNCTRDILFAADYFDGARIGGDIFKWDEFISQCIDKVFKYYVYHNVLWYADMDNIVIRRELNNMDQACSRVSFYGLAGVPVTMGDPLPVLEEQRVGLLKKILPVLDIHPMDIKEMKRNTSVTFVNLNIAKRYGDWNVVDVLNTTPKPADVRLYFDSDLNLDVGNGVFYLVYDFWENKFLGIRSESMDFELPAFASGVVSIHQYKGHPQVISTSRHITQGAYDLEYLDWDNKKLTLRGRSRVIRGEEYHIAIYAPDGYEIIEAEAEQNTKINFFVNDEITIVELIPGKSATESWSAVFIKTQGG